jgi:hypothetical protein
VSRATSATSVDGQAERLRLLAAADQEAESFIAFVDEHDENSAYGPGIDV